MKANLQSIASSQEALLSSLTQRCLRWNGRRHSYRPAGEPLKTDSYGVEPIDEEQAKAFVTRHHYSGSYPAARFRAGLFEHRAFQGGRLVGVAVFSVPMTQAVIPKYLGVGADAGVELGRFVLLDDVPANAETWFLARAFKAMRRHLSVDGVVSFCDPVARFDTEGREVKRTHTGVIYRAHNATPAGRTLARTLLLMPNGLCASDRTLSKIRNEEVGMDYAMRQLLSAGAPTRWVGETGCDWVRRLRRDGFFRSVRHPGNLAFTWKWK
ncbi:Mom family adenine methylcarbamoylation protein [Ramlibacter sp. AN1133]|uniref:Mom family adenine methylcarbamoylation protein n=1 Tax=Ramlibacter sp. AN1133 TaxID=3133429 RepID=UPI0030C47A99